MKIYDTKVELSAIVGANRQYIEATIPHIKALLHSSLESVVADWLETHRNSRAYSSSCGRTTS